MPKGFKSYGAFITDKHSGVKIETNPDDNRRVFRSATQPLDDRDIGAVLFHVLYLKSIAFTSSLTGPFDLIHLVNHHRQFDHKYRPERPQMDKGGYRKRQSIRTWLFFFALHAQIPQFVHEADAPIHSSIVSNR